MGVGLPPVRVCASGYHIVAVLKYLLIPSRSHLNISRVFFHNGIGYRYNLVCTYKPFTVMHR